MALQDIIEALGDKAGLATEVKGLYENNTKNVERIGTLETELSDAVARRKKLHETVSKTTGLAELSEEALTKYAENADTGLKADNETLQAKLAELKGQYDGLGQQHENEISEMILKDTLRGFGIADRVQNDRAFAELTKLVLDGAERDGATFVFKKDGQTIFDNGGKPMGVEERIAELQESEYSYLFRPVQGGGGGQGGKSPENIKQQTKMESDVSSVLSGF